jgi:L-2-aminoadipate reductase
LHIQNGPLRLRHHRPTIQYPRARIGRHKRQTATLYDDREQTGQDVSAGTGVTEATVRLYLAYLVAIGFLPAPLSNGIGTKALPTVELSDEQKQVLAGVRGRRGRQ